MADEKDKQGKKVAVVVLPALAEVAYFYLPEMNEAGASLPGVPLSNLLAEQVERYPAWIQRSIAASPMYAKNEKPAKAEGGK